MTTRLGFGLHTTFLRPYKTTFPHNHLNLSKPAIRISTPLISRPLHRTNTTTAVRINHNTRVNGPVSTLPAPLVLPSRGPNESFITFAFKRGKGYLSFYKTGLKNVYKNYQHSRLIQQQIRKKANSSLSTAVSESLITRSDFQLLHRSRHDIRRIPLFILVFIICGEFTPLVVLFMTGVVPTTCKIPSQISKEREKVEKRRKESFRELDTLLPPSTKTTEKEKENTNNKTPSTTSLTTTQLHHISNTLNLFSTLWPRSLNLPTKNMLQHRINKKIQYLEQDDLLILRNGGISQMEMEEIRRACEERGIDVLGRNDEILRGALKKWLSAREKKNSIERLLLSRPSVWKI